MNQTPVLLGLGGALGLIATRAVQQRLELSRAKHPSVSGHSRIAAMLSRWVPAYEYGEHEVFGVDGAPEAVVDRRRQAFARLGERLESGREATLKASSEAREGISDMQFVSRYRVPFQFSRIVRDRLKVGSVLSSSGGVRVTDLDGNEAIDLTGSYGVNVFGYDFYKECLDEAVVQARSLGPVLGQYHPTVVDNVRRLRTISGLDEVSFHMSGTEAIMQAVRVARYHTRRSHIVRFCGAYHGWWDDVQPGVGNPTPAEKTYTLKDVDDASLQVLRRRGDIACVLVNPLQALHPNVGAPSDSQLLSGRSTAPVDRAAYKAWLSRLRDVCTERGIVLIMDEIFMGFRLARRGAQEYFGVQADIVTYGKTLAGGLPIGVVCGRRDLMRRFRADRPLDICFARGTFNAHPYVMTAMNVFLSRLERPEIDSVYDDLERTWNRRADDLNRRLATLDVPIRIANLSSIWTVLYPEPGCYHWLFQYYLRVHGLALSWIGTGRLIFSHNFTDADFEAVAQKFEAAARDMKEDGWWFRAPGLSESTIHRRLLREIAGRMLRRG